MANSFSIGLGVLEGRLTAARAGYLDNLSGGAVALASVMSATRGGYLDNLSVGAVALDSKMDIVDTNVDTLLTRLSAARAGYLDNLNTPFASIQQGQVNIGTSTGVGTATISSVDLTKSIMLYIGHTSNATGMAADDDLAHLTLTNTTTVTANRYASPATLLAIRFMVVEWA